MSNPFDQFDAPAAEGGNPFDQFDAPAAKKLPSKGILSDVGGAFVEGAKSAGRAIAGTANIYAGDESALVEKAQAQESAQAQKPAALTAFNQAVTERVKPLGDDPGLLDSVKAIGGAVVDQPKGAGLAVVEQLPNAAPAIAGGMAGMKAGAALGTAIMPGVGTTIGAIGGGLAGMFLGNTAIETGYKGIEAAQDGAVTQDEMSRVKKEGAVKAGVITGVDALTLGLSKAVTNIPARAVESATRNALTKAGVNVADEAAVLAARQSPEISAAVRAAQESAFASANTLGKRAAAGGAALGLETVGEGLGEYLGELAATGKANVADAVLEAMMSLGQSGAEVAWGAARNKKAEQGGMWDTAEAKFQPPPPTLVTEPEPLQQRIDALMGIDTGAMSDKERTQYEKDLTAAFLEPVGVTQDEHGLEIPFTMADYLNAQVRAEDSVRARPLKQNAADQSGNRLQQLADEETQQQPDIPGYVAPEIPVVGTLSAIANAAVQSGAHQTAVMQQAAAQAAKNTPPEGKAGTPAGAQNVATAPAQGPLTEVAGQAPNVATSAPNVATPASAFDVSGKNILQLKHLAAKGQPGWKEAATAELVRLNGSISESVPALNAGNSVNLPATSISSLQDQLDKTEPFSEQSQLLTERLQLAVTDDAKSAIGAGEMPVYKVTDHVSVAIHPSAQKEGMIQVTRYTKDGVIGDSQYNSIDEAVRFEGLTHKPRIPSNEAIAHIENSIAAEAEYQKRKNEQQAGAGLPASTAGGSRPAPVANQEPVKNQSEQPLDMVPAADAVSQPKTDTAPEAKQDNAPVSTLQPDPALQNRDRGRAASVNQMQSIARNPDYMRLGPSRTPDSGAPMVFAVGGDTNKIAPSSFGANDIAVMSDGQRVPFRYAVVDASSVEPSNFADGATNPAFASNAPGTIKALNNGRTAGVRAAHEGSKAANYTAELLADQAHGVSPEAIRNTPNPMLVRVYAEQANTGDMAAKSQGQGLGMSASERATQDAELMTADVLDKFAPGDIASAGNRDFVRAFVGKLAENELADMMDATGNLSQDGRRRIEAALLTAAYGKSDLVQELFESTDTDIKAIGNALKVLSGQWASMRNAAKDGTIDPDTDMTANLMEAVNIVRRSRAEGSSIAELAGQGDLMGGNYLNELSELFLRIFYKGKNYDRARGGDKVIAALHDVVTSAMNTKAEAGLFGDSFKATPKQIVESARSKIDEENKPASQAALFGANGQVAAVSQGNRSEGTAQPGQVGSRPVGTDRSQEAGKQAEPVAKAAEQSPAVDAKEPWQMTRKEWYDAKNNDRAETFGSSGKRNGAAETAARIERKARLNYGVAENGEPVDHRQVIEKAIADGKQIPDEVLADYPDLKESGIALLSPSLGRVDANKVDIAVASKVVADLLSGWRNAPDSRVVATFDDLPAAVRKEIEDQGEKTARGVFHGDTFYLIADEHASANEIEETIFHEVWAHYGLRSMLGANTTRELAGVFDQISASGIMGVNGKDAFRAFARRNGFNTAQTESMLRKAEAFDPRFTEAMKKRILVEELIAKVQEKGDNPSLKRKAQEIIGAIREWLRKVGFSGLMKYSDADLMRLVQKARDTVKYGKRGSSGKGDVPSVLMTAWHGSPHDHDKFDSSKIGTGEGAQAYGYGHYFAGAKDVAEWYRRKLSGADNSSITFNGKQYGDSDAANRKLTNDVKKWAEETGRDPERIDVALEYLAGMAGDLGSARQLAAKEGLGISHWIYGTLNDLSEHLYPSPNGRLYQVELAPTADEYLDWDKPLSEQSEFVRNALTDKSHFIGEYLSDTLEIAKNNGVDFNERGDTLYKIVSDQYGSDKAASDYLHSIGIRGIRYLDGSSRSAGEGNSNYVIFNDADVSITAKYNIASKDKLTPADKAIYGMAAEGKSAAEVLKFIASASRSPFNRQVAKLLMKTGIAPSVTVGDGKGWKMNAGEGNKYAAGYNPKTDTISLFRPASSERNMLHELIHAATLKALSKKGMASAQMNALYQHVKKSGKLKGMYGMSDVDEFIAEAFSNPKFQAALKQVAAPSTSTAKSAWHWFVRVIKGILGLPSGSENALSQALEIGIGVMRENMRLNEGAGDVRYNAAPGKINQTDTEAFRKWFGDSRVVDADGKPMRVYHGTGATDIGAFNVSDRGSYGGGIYLTPEIRGANDYAIYRGAPSSTVYPVYAAIKNPASGSEAAQVASWKGEENAREELIRRGFDGVVDMRSGEIVAFYPEQIKSAIGNSGDFDATNPDIRYNVADEGGDIGRIVGDSVSDQLKAAVLRLSGRPMLDHTDPFAAENARLREQDQSLWSKAKKQLRRYLAPGGLLPQSVFAEKIKRDSEFQAVEFDVRHLIGGLEHAVKADFGIAFDKLSKEQMRPITEALAGNVPASLPEATKTAAVAMRQYIDGMSTEYLKIIQQKIDAKMLKALESGKDSDKAQAINEIELFEKIKGNIGRYVHRSYQAFDDPKWFEKVPAHVLNASRLYLKQGYMEAGENDAKASQMAEVTLHEILKNGTAYDSMESFIAESKLGAKDLSVLMRRKEVPAQIRALLGEYPDARLNFTKSATKMGRLIWNTRFLDRVRDMGMGSFFFEGKDRPPNATTQIAADGSEAYAPLNGLWTFPETAQAFKDALGKEQMSDLYRAIVRANGLVKYGKAQPLDAEIKTPTGPIVMGDVEVGTVVCGIDGPTTVTGVFPQGDMDVYRLTFCDGSSTEASDEHLWNVTIDGKERTLTTADLLSLPSYRIAKRQVSVPLGRAHFDTKDVPLDPYLMGVLLGDGSFRGSVLRLSTPEKDIVDRVRALLPEGYAMNSPASWSDIDYAITAPNKSEGRRHKIRAALEEMGLWGHLSLDKFIPVQYMRNSHEIRMEVARGLLDTDGWVDRLGQPHFTTSSRRLAEDFQELAESLGASVIWGEKESASGNIAYDLGVRVEDARKWFWLPRKAEKATPRKKPAKRTISTIEYVGMKQCQCIMVDDPRHLYLTDRFIVTHNTVLAPTTAMRNWQSAMFFSLANGHFDLTQMKKSISAFREQVSQKATGQDLKYLRHLKQLGVVYDTPYAGEMARLMEDARMEELLSSDKGDAVRWFRKANQLAQGFYTFGDDFWKIIGFENEKAGLMKAGLSLQEAEIEAAKRIRDTYPTYSMVGRGIQWLSRFPLAGTFVSFPAEIIRTSGNMLRTVAADLKSDNPKLRELGMKRAAGMVFVSAAFYSLAALSMAMAGVGDDEDEAIRDLAPEWQKNSTFLYLGRDEKGNLRYFDMSFLDPYGYWKRPITAMLRNQPWEDSLASGLRGMLEPFIGADIAAKAIFEAVANQKENGGKVYKEKDGAINQTIDVADHLRKALQPGVVGNVERLVKAAGDVRKSSGQPYSMEDELVALVGWRATTIDPKTALYYRSFEFTDAVAEARKTITETLRDANEITPEDIADAKARAQAKQEQAFKEMHRLVSAAESAGMSKMQIVQTLRLSNISQANIGSLMRGETPDVSITPQLAARAVRQASQMRGPEYAAEVFDRYRQARAN